MLPPLAFVSASARARKLDGALLRHFVASLAAVVAPPFSHEFCAAALDCCAAVSEAVGRGRGAAGLGEDGQYLRTMLEDHLVATASA